MARHRRDRLLALSLFPLVLGATSAHAQPAYYPGPPDAPLAARSALVIGISLYKEAVFPSLKNPETDAGTIRATLERLGFKVYPRSADDVFSRQTFKRVLYDYVDHVKEVGGLSLLYFAGHGVSYNGASYLVPADGMATYARDIREELIPLDLITESLQAMGKDVQHIVILDACRNPGFGTLPTLGSGASMAITAGIAFDLPDDVFWATSTKLGEFAQDGDVISPYAYALSSYMLRPNEPLSVTFDGVTDYFKELARQRGPGTPPQHPMIQTASSLGSKFYFAPTEETFAREKRAWDAIDPTRDRSQYQTFLVGFPVGYFAQQARRLRDQPPVIAQPAQQPVRVTVNSASVREEPSSTASVSATVKKGTHLAAVGTAASASGDWTEVRAAAGAAGFILTKQVERAPIATRKLLLVYSPNASDDPPAALAVFLQSVTPETVIEIRLSAYSRQAENPKVSSAVTRLLKIQAMLEDRKINPAVVKVAITPTDIPDKLDQIDLEATVPAK